VTEGSQISKQGVGYIRTPGIHTPEQIAGWKQVTETVHQANGKISLQLWHVGRVSHPDFHDGELPVAPSALPVNGEAYTFRGRSKIETPRALELNEIQSIIEQFRIGALNAKKAGFDGVELHGANGYLIEQFLKDGSNQRTDGYGGSIQNRARFALEVVEAVASVWGPERVGIKISPYFSGYSMSDSNPMETYSYLSRELNSLNIAYLHTVENAASVGNVQPLAPMLRKNFHGTLILNGGYDLQTGNAAIEQGLADLIAYGTLFLANPDLPKRFKEKAQLNVPDSTTFYQGEERGYIDYPIL
jgi:N-ethylmaleimide reductase